MAKLVEILITNPTGNDSEMKRYGFIALSVKNAGETSDMRFSSLKAARAQAEFIKCRVHYLYGTEAVGLIRKSIPSGSRGGCNIVGYGENLPDTFTNDKLDKYDFLIKKAFDCQEKK